VRPEHDLEERPLAWTAVLAETPVISSDGVAVGRVAEVLGSPEEDIFHGIVVSPGNDITGVLIPAESVAEITTRAISVRLLAEEIRALPPYEETETFHLGFTGLLGRTLGWVQDRHDNP
jgi:sporulation protein YlmC with PRC-barrel domain